MASSSQAGERGSIAFVSYARADAEFALRLARDLKSAGASVWLDQLDIIPGQRWDVAVQAALARCDPMLVILSPATADSNNVMDEVSYALEERKTIVPILHIQCAVPFRLRRLQYADFRQEYQHGLTTLLKTLEVDRTAHEAETPKAGDVKTNPDDGQPYVWIPPGEFQMGCSPGDNECAEDEKPAHTVRISRGFWLGQTPVTVGAYKRFAERTGVPMPGEPLLGKVKLNAQWSDLEQPMVGVTWEEARSYCESWANGRLPTEAEWEWAARAGSTAARYAELDVIAWYADNSGNQPLDSTRA